MKKYNLSNIMKRAWELVKKLGLSISEGLKKAWKEAKEVKENIIETLKANLEEMAYNCKYITLGIERTVSAKLWGKGENKRMYLNVSCYTANGRYKGQYKAGYVDMLTGKYVVGKYDDINAEDKEYIGR